jgi:hypothetical protein
MQSKQETSMNPLISILIVGVGATAVVDLWAIVRKQLFAIPPPDYGLVGRWLAHMTRGRFRHDSIAKSLPIRGERVIGWTTHYLIGIAFAAMLIGIFGIDWLQRPTLGPALIVGIGTVTAPFLLMQPGMGAGIAASRTARPNASRLQSLITHTIFGFGLYVAGWTAHYMSSL